jgi:hypothetical protein
MTRISQIIGPPLVKNVGNMDLLYGSRRKVQSAKCASSFTEPLPEICRVATTVNDGVNESRFAGDGIINREREFFGQQPVKVFMRLQMDSRIERQRINIRINVFEEMQAQPDACDS